MIQQLTIVDKKLGEGTYAVVHLGHLRSDPISKVAIKKIKVLADYQDGLSLDAIREVKFLQELSHPNVIALHAVFASKRQNLNLVLEYLPRGDLEMLIKDTAGVSYGAADIKAWMGMLGRGMWFCHAHFVLHRDIKPNNCLIAADGTLKLADFGLARSFADPYRPMTSTVVTRWYRAPELLFQARHYAGAVDVWSVGCVFAELVLRTPYLAGVSDLNQLDLIGRAVGTPTEDNWPGVGQLPGYVRPEATHPVRGRDFYAATFGTVGPLGVDLLMATLRLDPRRRVSARGFLEHGWWAAEPRPTRAEDLPRKGGGEAAERMGEDLQRRVGELADGATDNVARRLDFGARR